ncbi:alanine racemase [bacterium]|nr:alanine racemase [bacterium]
MTHTATLTVDLAMLRHNHQQLKKLAGDSRVACVVKANAYGMGMERVAQELAMDGCQRFYVAHMEGALTLAEQIPSVRIAVLHGPDKDTALPMAEAGLEAVINCPEQLYWWQAAAKKLGRALPATLHVDTGMHRLGFAMEGFTELFNQPGRLEGISVTQVMSHLACADEPEHPLNGFQHANMCLVRKQLPHIPLSFASSAGMFLGPAWHFDEVRPGAALYGIRLTPKMQEAIHPIATLTAPLIMFKDVKKNDSVGYGASYVMPEDGKIAVAPLGYADGLPRRLSNGGHVWLTDGVRHVPCEIGGRVSMDLVTLIVSELEDDFLRRAWVEWFGPLQPVEKVAAEAGTMGYEILTLLGKRLQRHYINGLASVHAHA